MSKKITTTLVCDCCGHQEKIDSDEPIVNINSGSDKWGKMLLWSPRAIAGSDFKGRSTIGKLPEATSTILQDGADVCATCYVMFMQTWANPIKVKK